MRRRDDDTCGGTGAWNREAQRVRELAARRGLRLDEEELVLCDVRDLQALSAALRPPAAAAVQGLGGLARASRRLPTRLATGAAAALAHRA